MQVLRIRSKFWGKSMEFQPEGEVRAKYFISQIFCKFLNLDIFNQNSGAIKATIDHFRHIIAWKLWTNLTVCQSLVCPRYPLEKLHLRWVWDWKIGGRSTLGTKSPAASTTCLVLRGRLTPTKNTKYRIAWHHKYKHQIYVKYKLPTFLHQVGWPLRGEHYLVPILRTFCKDSVCQGFLLEQ